MKNQTVLIMERGLIDFIDEQYRARSMPAATDAAIASGVKKAKDIALTACGTNWKTRFASIFSNMKAAIDRMASRYQLGSSFSPIVRSDVTGHWITADNYIRESLEKGNVRSYGNR